MLKNQCIGHRAPDGRNWAASSGALFCFVIYLAQGHSPSRALFLPLHQCDRPNRGSQSDFTLQAILAPNVVTPFEGCNFCVGFARLSNIQLLKQLACILGTGMDYSFASCWGTLQAEPVSHLVARTVDSRWLWVETAARPSRTVSTVAQKSQCAVSLFLSQKIYSGRNGGGGGGGGGVGGWGESTM